MCGCVGGGGWDEKEGEREGKRKKRRGKEKKDGGEKRSGKAVTGKRSITFH